MKIVIQRVREASVTINANVTAAIQKGLLILCGFEEHDSASTLKSMLHKCLNYRIFTDTNGKMNLNLQEIEGGLLLVPQFTLMANTSKGLRPGFSNGASFEKGLNLFLNLVQLAKAQYPKVQSGSFGADMQICLCNDGPVTFILNF